MTDLPVDAMTDDIVDSVKETLQSFEDLDLFIHRDRQTAVEAVAGADEAF